MFVVMAVNVSETGRSPVLAPCAETMAVVATSATKTATARQIRSVDFMIDLLASSDTTLPLPGWSFPAVVVVLEECVCESSDGSSAI